MCHSGALGQAESDLAPLRQFGPPILDLVQPMPYPVVNTILDDAFPRGALNYWKSAFFTELSDGAVQTMIEAFEATPSIMTGMVIEHFHGAVCRVDPTATAYPFREPGYNLVLIGQWNEPADTDANMAWVRDTFAALQPYTAPKVYVSYLADDEGSRVGDAYRPNLERSSTSSGATSDTCSTSTRTWTSGWAVWTTGARGSARRPGAPSTTTNYADKPPVPPA